MKLKKQLKQTPFDYSFNANDYLIDFLKDKELKKLSKINKLLGKESFSDFYWRINEELELLDMTHEQFYNCLLKKLTEKKLFKSVDSNKSLYDLFSLYKALYLDECKCILSDVEKLVIKLSNK